MLQGKNILLGVTGSIAAYKSALLVRLLVKKGARVKVIMTPSAGDFITPLTLSVLSKNEVHTSFVKGSTWDNHVELALWADVMIIAPASANTIGKMAAGLCDNLLLAAYLSARCPVFVAPAMDVDMLRHPSSRENIAKIKSFGNHLIAPASGELASGLEGEGRMEEPEEIVIRLEKFLKKKAPLNGIKALVTAGPTYEAIDPVRFIGNHSSGKMGFAIAGELAAQGAEVELVTGPTYLAVDHPGIRRTDVTSAVEMKKACERYFASSDITVMAAAVADFMPVKAAGHKIKKNGAALHLQLTGTPDILEELGKKKKKSQVLVGFALETDKGMENAKVKLKKKNLDLVVLNSPDKRGTGFAFDTNQVTMIDRYNKVTTFGLKSKAGVARDLVNQIRLLK